MNSIGREHAEGAVAVTTALILVLLLSLAAFVVDLAVVRADNRSSQSAADHAVVAGAAQLGENSFADACATTWQYLTANISASAASTAPGSCATVFGSMTKETCALRAGNSAVPTSDPTTDPALFGPLFITESIGEFTVTIQMPVRDGDELMGAQASDPDFDGTNPCERVGMRLARSRPGIFSSFAGGDGTNTGVIDAVARLVERGRIEEYATLIILDQVGCDALVTAGNGAGVVVFDGVDADGVPSPGIITSDSGGSGCSNSVNDAVYDTGGNGIICAGASVIDNGVPPAETYLSVAQAMATSGSCFVPTVSIRDNTIRSGASPVRYENAVTPNSIAPDVTAGEFWGRQQIDHDYNCVGTYPPYSTTKPQYPYDQGSANPPYTDVEPCTSGRDPGIDLLVDAFVNQSLQTDTAFFQLVSNCNDQTVNATKPWVYIDCKNQGKLTLNGANLVVVKQFGGAQPGIKMSNGDRLVVNPLGGKDAIMVVPSGGMTFPGGILELNNTFVYLHSGGLTVNSQATDTLEWSAPNIEKGWNEDDTRAQCQVSAVDSTNVTLPNGLELPSAPCFEDLALWSNDTVAHSFGGQATVDVAGIFFAPNAGRKNNSSFSLSGGGQGLDLSFAQFFTWRLSVGGSAAVIMRPDPENFSSKPRYGSGLIR